jgi:hypothetical protein
MLSPRDFLKSKGKLDCLGGKKEKHKNPTVTQGNYKGRSEALSAMSGRILLFFLSALNVGGAITTTMLNSCG